MVPGLGALKPTTLVASYLMPTIYVPAELALNVMVVTPFDVLMFALIFVQPDVYTKLPAAWLKKWLLKLPVVIAWSIVKVLLPALASTSTQ